MHRLRAEVGELKRRLAETQAVARTAPSAPDKALAPSQPPIPAEFRDRILPLDQAPSLVQSAIVREIGDGLSVGPSCRNWAKTASRRL